MPAKIYRNHNELIDRLLKGRCKQCGSEDIVHMHYVKKLKGLKKTGKEKAVWFKRIIEI